MVSTRSSGKKSSTVRKRPSKSGKGGSTSTASGRPPLVDTRDPVKRSLEVEVPSAPIVWTWRLRMRYWAGFLLGLIACVGTIVTYDREDDWKAVKFMLWLGVSLGGLYLNETRPGKKYFYDQSGRVMSA
jgi:hypothetical protein